jgi:tripartite-type tricarboxylate transporter receptor subunit TctC
MAEAGLPDFEAENWHGYAAPAATPKAVVNQLYRDIAKIVDTTEMRERLMALGLVPDTTVLTPEQFAAIIKREISRYAIAIKAAGATAR